MKHSSNNTRQTARYFWRHVAAYPRLVAGILCSLPLTILVNSYLPPLILANVLTRLARQDFVPRDIWSSFGPQLLLYSSLLFIGIGAWRLVDFFAWRLEAYVQRDIAEEVFAHMISQSADFHANNFSGSLVSQNSKLLSGYVRIADTTIFMVMPLLLGLVFVSIILMPRSPLFVAVLLVLATLYIVTAFQVAKPVRQLSAEHSETESKQTGFLADAITNVMAIKSYAQGPYERQRFSKATAATEKSLFRFSRVHRRQMNYLGLLNRTISGLALAVAVVSVVNFNADIGTVFLIFSYTSSIVEQLFGFSNNALRNYNRAFGEASEMVQKLAAEPEIRDTSNPQPARIVRGEITFHDVTFAHKDSDGALFNRLSFKIKPGEKVGLVGHSGSGKTTLTKLLLRFADIQGGEIHIDGQNITTITQEDLRAHISYVPQEPLLFHRSLRENIAYGQSDATERQIIAVAKMAHAHEFIEKLPDGYDTLVGERGVKLSGGQRQRIAIARAMIKNAPILVLDEATSALDSDSEQLIQQALWKLMQNRTAIVIAHRLSTIQKMDRILVLEDGAIVEQGTHKELIRQNGTYSKLWNHQSGGFLEE